MIAELLAIVAAVLFGLTLVTIRRGLAHSSVTTGIVFSVLATELFLVIPGFVLDAPPRFIPGVVALLALAGIIGPMLGRIALMAGISRLGASTAGPLHGTYPFFTFILAVTFLGESVTLTTLLGTALVVGGVGILMAWGRAQPVHRAATGRDWMGVSCTLTGAFLFALGDVMARAGIVELRHPVFGAATMYLAASVGVVASLAAFPRFRKEVVLAAPALRWFLVAGAVQALGVMALFAALNVGEVVRVTPIIGASPLFVLLWSVVLLRQTEALRPSTIIGALTVVAGIAVVTVGRVLPGAETVPR